MVVGKRALAANQRVVFLGGARSDRRRILMGAAMDRQFPLEAFNMQRFARQRKTLSARLATAPVRTPPRKRNPLRACTIKKPGRAEALI